MAWQKKHLNDTDAVRMALEELRKLRDDQPTAWNAWEGTARLHSVMRRSDRIRRRERGRSQARGGDRDRGDGAAVRGRLHLMPFAQGTTVTTEKTRSEIESLVKKYGATEFGSGWANGQAAVTFVANGRRVRFSVSAPTGEKGTPEWKRAYKRRGWYTRSGALIAEEVAAEDRRRWRCLLLAIKAKLEIVATGISSFDEEFLAHVVTETGETVFERIKQLPAGNRMLPAIGD